MSVQVDIDRERTSTPAAVFAGRPIPQVGGANPRPHPKGYRVAYHPEAGGPAVILKFTEHDTFEENLQDTLDFIRTLEPHVLRHWIGLEIVYG